MENFFNDTEEVLNITKRLIDKEVLMNCTGSSRFLIKGFKDGSHWQGIPIPGKVHDLFAVTPALADLLEEHGQCVLRNDHGTWWGRCTSGQPLVQDGIFQEIARKIHAEKE